MLFCKDSNTLYGCMEVRITLEWQENTSAEEPSKLKNVNALGETASDRVNNKKALKKQCAFILG